MLILAARVFPHRIKAATVDHRLRPEAADEARFVASICETLNIPHTILAVNAPITGNVQSGARAARYALLDHWADEHDCRWIATAHHADDQLETLLMRLARGSGVAGMAGIRAQNGRIIRPMLGFDKVELEAICAEAAIVPCRDPSNENADYDRVRMRNWLRSTPTPLDPHAAVRTAEALASTQEAMAWMTASLANERITSPSPPEILADMRDLPVALQRSLLLHTLAIAEPGLNPRGDAIDRALLALHAGEKLTLGSLLCVGGDIWSIRPAPLRRH